MTKSLRTTSGPRLLATIAATVAVICAGAAVALAAGGGGPLPPPQPLAKAIRAAIAAPSPSGFSADVSFVNRLIDAANLQGSDPLLSGATGRIWVTADRLRLELQGEGGGGDAEVVVQGRSFWAYDPGSRTVYKGTLPAGAASRDRSGSAAAEPLPSLAQITHVLARLGAYVNLSGATPANVGGRPAYAVSASPKDKGGLLGSLAVAWDAVRGVPLRFAVYARGSSTPVIELSASHVGYGPLSAADFAASPPAGAKVVQVDLGALSARATATRNGMEADRTDSARSTETPAVTGVGAVAARLPFTLDAPGSVASLARSGVRLLGRGAHAAALITYGHGLGAVAVIERPATKAAAAHLPAAPRGEGEAGLSIPTVSLRGATAQELSTALGTVLHFTRGNVAFIVAGSVPAPTARAVARAL